MNPNIHKKQRNLRVNDILKKKNSHHLKFRAKTRYWRHCQGERCRRPASCPRWWPCSGHDPGDSGPSRSFLDERHRTLWRGDSGRRPICPGGQTQGQRTAKEWHGIMTALHTCHVYTWSCRCSDLDHFSSNPWVHSASSIIIFLVVIVLNAQLHFIFHLTQFWIGDQLGTESWNPTKSSNTIQQRAASKR